MIPEFIRGLLNTRYEREEAKRVLTGYAQRRPVTFRANLLKTSAEEVASRCAKLGIEVGRAPVADAFVVKNLREREIAQTPLYRNGEIYLQSLSSMLPPYLLAPKAGENILDMAAAPGGKTALLSALSGGTAFLTACEKDKIRAERLKYNLEKQGVPRVSILVQDALMLDEFFRFDKILLDAPCSGSGTLTGDGNEKISEKLIKNSAALQEKLLRKALKLVKKGGIVAYSTCSVLKEENDDVVEKILKEGGCELLPCALPFETPRMNSLNDTYLVPPDSLFEGFFMALLKKK